MLSLLFLFLQGNVFSIQFLQKVKSDIEIKIGFEIKILSVDSIVQIIQSI